MKYLKKISIPLSCPSCKKEVIWDECYIGPDEETPIAAEELCPDCLDSCYSDLRLIYEQN